MNSKKFILGGIIGAIAYFLLGWLVWGNLLASFMLEHSSPHASDIFRTEASMIWWSLIVGNIAMGFLFSCVLSKAGVNSAVSGFTTAGIIGLLMAVGVDCIMYAQMKVYGTKAIAVDIIAATIVAAIVGGIIGWYRGMGK